MCGMHHAGFAPMLRTLAAAVLLAAPGIALAQPSPRVAPVFDALGIGELLEIMREEGLGYGDDLEADLFPGKGRDAWDASVAAIYALPRMEAAIAEGLDAGLSDSDIAGVLEFFASDAGRKIVGLEVAARRAMLDEGVEESAREGWQALEAEGGRRWEQLIEFAERNDLVESNVAGAMTSNYEFYTGLADGNAFDYELTEDQILSDVWSQEESIREDTVDWVFSFTSLAYQPLTEDEFQRYIDFAGTPEGQALNTALFQAFNQLFADISRDLGLAASRYLAGQDI